MFLIHFLCLVFGIKLPQDKKKELNSYIKEWRKNKGGAMPEGLKSFVQKNVSNKAVVKVYDTIRKFTPLSAKYRKRNLRQNLALADANELPDLATTGYLERQYSPAWEKVGFGKKVTVAYAGCEVMACFNALKALGEDVNYAFFCELISHFEKKGVALYGEIGVSPKALYRYFKKRGYRVEFRTCDEAGDLAYLEEHFHVFIATVYNSETDISEEVHTVCIRECEDGKYVVHNARNAYGKSFEDLKTALNNISAKNPKVLSIMGVKKFS